jgi:hypothetical protein
VIRSSPVSELASESWSALAFANRVAREIEHVLAEDEGD